MKFPKALLSTALLLTLVFSCKTGEDPITVTTSNFAVTIDENPTAGQSLGMVSGTTSSGSVTFTLTAQTPAGAFAISASSGDLTVANASLFDFEANPTLTATVTVANGSVSQTATVTVTLNNVPDAVNAMDETVSIDENPTAQDIVTTVSATNDAGTLTYTIDSQTPNGAFLLNGSTGALTVEDASLFDFEVNPTLTVTFTASNGTVSDQGTITVNLNNVLETLTTQDETVNIDENPNTNQELVTITSNTDLGDATFSLANESVTGAFAIDATTGKLTVADASKFDYETNTSLTATVNLTNGSLMATSIVTVNLNDVFELVWSQISASAGFGDRYSHGFVELNGKMWIIGGISGINRTNQIWSSSDGITWTQATIAGNIFSARNDFDAIVFNNKIWVIGGFTDNGRTNEIWSSPDGTTWTQETPVGNIFTARGGGQTVIFNNKLWLIGGNINAGDPTNEIWSTSDGTTWTLEVTTNIFSGRMGHQAVTLNSKIYVIAGSSYNNDQILVQGNEVWSSSDGTTWTQENASGHFSSRWLHRVVAHNGELWLIGGEVNGVRSKEVWKSSDGINWTDMSSESTFDVRDNLGLLVFNGKMWITGGSNGNGTLSDVWSSN